MTELFAWLTHAVEGSTLLALWAAFLWGILSILLSPCHLASIPLIVAFISQEQRLSTRRAALLACLFATGILLTIAAIGVLTAAAGRMLGDVGGYANYFVAAIFFAVGLHLLGVLPMPLGGPGKVALRSKGPWAALVLGLVFGIALGPCTFAYMAPILGVSFKLGASSLAYGSLLLLAYGAGHCGVIIAAGASATAVQRYLDSAAASKGTATLKGLCGVLLLCGGLYLLYTAT